MEWLILLGVIIISYLIGSINTAILVGKVLSGDDIRNHGSGNAGTTNALRTYGKKAAVIVLIGDALKAVISILLAILVSNLLCFTHEFTQIMIYGASVGAVLGHNFPIYFNFRGGKGVLVSAVAIFFADWSIGLIVFLIALSTMAISRFVSLGSVVGAISFVALALIFHYDNIGYIIYAILLASSLIIMHRTNIKRLLNGTENKLGRKE